MLPGFNERGAGARVAQPTAAQIKPIQSIPVDALLISDSFAQSLPRTRSRSSQSPPPASTPASTLLPRVTTSLCEPELLADEKYRSNVLEIGRFGYVTSV